jgi:Tol biopolymer transport system component
MPGRSSPSQSSPPLVFPPKPPKPPKPLKPLKELIVRVARVLAASLVLPLALLAGCGDRPNLPTDRPSTPTLPPATSTVASADPAPSVASPTGTIAFVRTLAGQRDIFVVRADGSGLTRITDDANLEGTLIWLLDGSRLLYTWSTEADPYQDHLVSIRPDGSDPQDLGRVQTIYDEPVWSPDGTKVAIGGDGSEEGDSGVSVVDLVKGTLRQLTSDGASYPRWSPDGTRLVAILLARRIETIDATTGAKVTIVEDESVQAPLGWTSNGSIAFSGCSPLMNKEECMAAPLLEVDADGSHPRAYTGSVPDRIEDVRSPNGQWIAVRRDDGIYVRAAAGSGEVRLDGVGRPSWSPNSSWLVFARAFAPTASVGSDPFGLVIVRRTGGSTINLTDGLDDSSPAWQPG